MNSLAHPLARPTAELSLAVRAARAAVNILSEYFRRGVTADNKTTGGQAQGLVTQADVDVEQAILGQIRSEFPGHAIMAEESQTEVVEAEKLWVVDPLDGTNNFANGVPHFAVSIGYYVNQRAELGVVVDPLRNDWFIAVRDQGAWHNDRRIRVNQNEQLGDSIVALGFYYDRGAMMRATLRAVEELFTRGVQGIRRMGTASLDLVQVGLGRFGGYFEYELSPWDFAAARLFVEEAGGSVTDCLGQTLPLQNTGVLASNGKLHPALLETVSKHAPKGNSCGF